jgi:hypothetical protein
LCFGYANAQRKIDVLRGLKDGSMKVVANTLFDIGTAKSMFDGNISTVARSPAINPLVVTLELSNTLSLSATKLNFGTAGYWTLEVATTAAGPYSLVFLARPLATNTWDSYTLPLAKEVKFLRISTTRTTGDNFVHLNEWEIYSDAPLLSYKICPEQYHLIKEANKQMQLYGFDANGNAFEMPSVNWSSSNNAVASITNAGMVTAGATVGNATITAKLGANNYTTSVMVDATFVPTKAPKKIVKVALILQDPQVPSQGNTRLSAAIGWENPVTLTNNLIQEMTNASDGTVEFQVTYTNNDNTLLTKIDGIAMNADDLYTWYKEPGFDTIINGNKESWYYPTLRKIYNQGRITLDYNDIINAYDLCTKRNNGEIDEVWVYGHPYTDMFESRLTGPGAFPYNSPPLIGGNNCAKLMVIMGFNYERGLAEAMHSTGHRAENALYQAFGRWEEQHLNPNAFEVYTAYDKLLPGEAQVGNIHFPPNGMSDYDYVNTTNVTTYADNWATYPLLQAKTRTINCSEWQCDHLGYMRWWFSHLPRWTGESEAVLNDWWKYIVDFEGAFAAASAIPECYFPNSNHSPVITSTPITSATVGMLYSYTLAATDVDPGEVLTYSAITMPAWLSFNASTKILAGTPSAANIGTHAVTLRVSDGKVNSDQSFVITVSAAGNVKLVDDFDNGDGLPGSKNDLGYAIETWRANTTVSNGVLSLSNIPGSTEVSWTTYCGNTNYKIYEGIAIKAKADRPTNVLLRIGKYTVAKTIALNTSFATFWIPFSDFGDNGTNIERITIGEFSNALATVMIDNISFGKTANGNYPPIITSTATTAALVGDLYTYTLVATDLDPADVLTYGAITLPSWLNFNSTTHVLSGTPTSPDKGDHTVALSVSDGKASTIQTFIITVSNKANMLLVDDFENGDGLPSSKNDLGFTIETWRANVTLSNGILSLANIPGSTEVSWTTNCGNANYKSYDGIAIQAKASVPTTLIVRIGKYTMAKNINLTTSFVTYWIPFSDFGVNGTNIERITIGEFSNALATVMIDNISFGKSNGLVNNPPVITSSPLTNVAPGILYAYTLNALDADPSDVLTYSAIVLPTWLSFNASSRLLSGTPTPADKGNHSVTLRVSDGKLYVDQVFVITVAKNNASNSMVVDDFENGDGLPGTTNDLGFGIEAWKSQLNVNAGILTIANELGRTDCSWTSLCGGLDYAAYQGIEIKAKASVNTVATVRLGQYNKALIHLTPNDQTFWLPWSSFALTGNVLNFISIGEFSPSTASLSIDYISLGAMLNAREKVLSEILSNDHDAGGNEVSIYPNPIQNSFQLKLNLKNESLVHIHLYSVTGEQLHDLSTHVWVPEGIEYMESIDASTLTSGVYYLHIAIGNHVMLKKIVKMN